MSMDSRYPSCKRSIWAWRNLRSVWEISSFRSRTCWARIRSQPANAAMANLAEAIQGLVHHMRTEQQMIRDWAEAQAKVNGDIRRFLEILAREPVDR